MMTCETARGIRGLLYISHNVSAFSLSSSDILVHLCIAHQSAHTSQLRHHAARPSGLCDAKRNPECWQVRWVFVL